MICIEIGGRAIPNIIKIKISLTIGINVNSNHFPEGESWSAEYIYAMYTEQNTGKKNLSEANGHPAVNSNLPPLDKTRTPRPLAVDMISNTSDREEIDVKNSNNMSVGDENESVKNGLNRDTVFGGDLSHLSITSSGEAFDQKFKGMKSLITSMDPNVQEAFSKVWTYVYICMHTSKNQFIFIFILCTLCTSIFMNINMYKKN